MEPFLILIGIAFACLPVVGTVCAIVALSRSKRLQTQLDLQKHELQSLRRRLAELGEGTSRGPAAARGAGPVEAPPSLPKSLTATRPPPPPAPQPAGALPSATLEIRIGDQAWETDLTSDVTTIGRAHDCVVSIRHESVSAVHCEIRRVGETFLISDSASLGGTRVNGKNVSSGVLTAGDRIRIGAVDITFRRAPVTFGAPAAAPTAEAVTPALPPAPQPAAAVPAATPEIQIAEPVTPASPPAPPPPSAPRVPSPAPAPAPRAPAFDWESLLGVRGAAWGGGLAFAIAGILFARYAFEHNWITPEMRIAAILLSGVAAILGAEFFLRKRYATTANAVCGGGIAVLYAGLYAARGVYHLLPTAPTFGAMIVVTVVAALLSVRYGAMGIAILGLVGGFATPILLSTGVDHPIGLFSYVLLLDVGLLWIAVRRRWTVLALLTLGATFFMQAAWFWRFMAPEKTAIAVVVFFVFAVLFLMLPAAAKGEQRAGLLGGSTAGGLAPFLFAFLIAGNRDYVGEWPLLFGFVGCLDAALIAVALFRGPVWLAASGASATAITLALWGMRGLDPRVLGRGVGEPTVWGASLLAIGLALLLNAPLRLPLRPVRALGDAARRTLASAGIIAWVGLVLYTLCLVGYGWGEPPWVFVCLVATQTAIVLERSAPRFAGAAGGSALRFVMPIGASIVAAVAQVWFFKSTDADALVGNLSLPLLLTVAFAIVSALREPREASPSVARLKSADEDGVGVVASNLIGVLGLFLCLGSTPLGRDPMHLFAALAASVVLLSLTGLRRDWTVLAPVGLAACAGHVTLWHENYYRAQDLGTALPFYAAFYLYFLAIPFVVPRSLAPRWRERVWPWVAASLAGPAFFWAIYRTVTAAWGKEWIGALPVAMGALSLGGLYGAKRLLAAGVEDPAAALRRLRVLALFGAVVLGFVSLAIPLQLDRQWITIGWTLEGAAVWWLYLQLPHPGLKYFGAALFYAVATRLLVNAEVLAYEPRGRPIFNWILYTYGVAAASALAGAAWLKTVESERVNALERRVFGDGRTGCVIGLGVLGVVGALMFMLRGEAGLAAAAVFVDVLLVASVLLVLRTGLAPIVGFLGLILIFALINLEIADYFSPGRTLSWSWERQYARDLTTSLAWGLYALTLLIVGMWRKGRPLRFVSLGFMLLTVAKVFLYDLSSLRDIYRVLSFLGLAVALILVSLLYQRFVFRKEEAA